MVSISAVILVLASITSEVLSENVCHLSPDTGSCGKKSKGKEESRYYYSPTNFKCAKFPYSGCKGNGNNFASEKECSEGCGTFNATEIQKLKNAAANSKCFFKGSLYAQGDSIPEVTTRNPCAKSCSCTKTPRKTSPQITCAEFDCPELTRPKHKQNSNCVLIYNDLNACCPSEFLCPDESTKDDIFTCEVDGKKYLNGQKFYPNQYPCLSCHCSKNFTGKISTKKGVCKEVDCGISIYNGEKIGSGCRPVYYKTSLKTLCCPIDWECDNQANSKKLPKPKASHPTVTAKPKRVSKTPKATK